MHIERQEKRRNNKVEVEILKRSCICIGGLVVLVLLCCKSAGCFILVDEFALLSFFSLFGWIGREDRLNPQLIS